MANCTSCNSEKAVFYIATETKLLAYCAVCSGRSPSASPDIAYPYGSGEHTEGNIAYPNGHPQAGQPIPFYDKRSKKRAMDIAGVREAGDRKHGALNQDHRPTGKKIFFT